MIEIIVALVSLLGSVLLVFASIGLVGAPHRHGRSDAVTKAGAFGAALIILAVSAAVGSVGLLVQGLVAATVLVLSGVLLAPILAEWDWIALISSRNIDETDEHK